MIPTKQHLYDHRYSVTKQETTNILQQLQLFLSRLCRNTDKVSVKTKQILLGALACVDDKGQITNEDALKCIHPEI